LYVCVYGPSCLLGSVHRWYSVVDMSCFQCGCGSSYLLGAIRPVLRVFENGV
jgi:hypothetical protein